MVRAQLTWMIQSGRGNKLRQRPNRFSVKIGDTDGLIGDHHGALTRPILAGDTRGAVTRVTLLGLNASDGKHEPARGVTPVGPERHDPRHVEARRDPAARANPNLVTQIGPDER